MKKPKAPPVPLKPSQWWAVVDADGNLGAHAFESRKKARTWLNLYGLLGDRIVKVEIREIKRCP